MKNKRKQHKGNFQRILSLVLAMMMVVTSCNWSLVVRAEETEAGVTARFRWYSTKRTFIIRTLRGNGRRLTTPLARKKIIPVIPQKPGR